jgi:hypothetical protein
MNYPQIRKEQSDKTLNVLQSAKVKQPFVTSAT